VTWSRLVASSGVTPKPDAEALLSRREARMASLRLVFVVLVFGFAVSDLAWSQSTPSSGTAPHERGNTGWTGGNAEQSFAIPDGNGLADHPWMATGVDLKGPPQRFPANKTPE